MKAKKNPNLDIGRNSSIYFAIGLNLMLFFTWQSLEYKSFDKDDIAIEILNIETEYEEDIPIVKLPEVAPPPVAEVVSESILIAENTEEIIETVIESTESNQAMAIEAQQPSIEIEAVQVEEVEEEVEVPFALIENIPVFPGCENLSKSENKKCFQDKLNEHIANNFRYPQSALDLGIQGRVSIMFFIDSDGQITGIRSRGPDEALKHEAERIIRLLPKMTPGSQRGKPVKVSYALPIFFKYEE
ncbi:TonB family protein [Formosa agariphila KMM 3901]|uniref:TonB family protein n=1 Tax=Formosa agariphila (strain DSM 15362 / KCTC 12365 / LMG 23005 / KMM 3901 / M-2Alg 35-1) TaxID=1347342 RepID=T2KIB5_FORAG|nr:energy transducer TonB [Formosa agariphila]CDF78173.1 TonB family protein [Formosa agariphila KMM 3901]